MKFVRTDIQTLRGVAVFFVVAYHFGVPGFANGFIGVDIFFVISGFLIMRAIQESRAEGFVGLLLFAESRCRRLYPALIVLIAGCLLFGFLTQPMEDFRRLSKHAAFATVFLSNIVFWREAGYFDAASHTKALLHTWSLGVEGQYYVLFAIFMFAVGRRLGSKSLSALIAIALAVSLATSIVWTPRDLSAAFYLLPTRLWEFLIGALVALRKAPLGLPKNVGRFSGHFVAAGLVAALIVDFPSSQFPGYWALLPTVPAAILIATGEFNTDSALWQSRPGVFLGDISYSFYLWHWPVYVFARALGYADGHVQSHALLFAASLALGYASYRFVETPFRRNREFWDTRRLSIAVAASMALSVPLLMMGTGAGLAAAGAMQTDASLIMAEFNNINPRRAECFLGQEIKSIDRPYCRMGDVNAEPSFVLWGDSHADAIMTIVGEVGKAHGRAGLFAGYSGCPPISNVDTSGDQCGPFNTKTYGAIAGNHAVTDVIMVARWSYYLLGEVGAASVGPKISLSGADSSMAGVREAYREGFLNTVCGLADTGKRVHVVGPIPEIRENVPGALAAPKASWIQRVIGKDRDIRVSMDTYRERNDFILSVMQDAKAKCGVDLLDPTKSLCTTGRCVVENGGRPLYRDGDHLSEYGSTFLRDTLNRAFN